MDYQKIFGCARCGNVNPQGECKQKRSFDNEDPSTCPFLYCPFFIHNFELMLPKKGDFYILNFDGVLYTPIYWDVDTRKYLQLRRCEIHMVGSCKHLVVDMKYPNLLDKDREYIIANSSVIHVDQSTITR